MFKKINHWYAIFFSVDEISLSKRLQAIFIASWALCVYDLTAVEKGIERYGSFRCWPYFENCHELKSFFLPESFLFSIWSGILLGILFLGMLFFVKKKWNYAHLSLLIVIIWKAVFNFYLFNPHTSNFELFHLFPSFVLLFSKNKWHSIKFTYAFMYLFTPRVKFDDGWILGTYFSSTINGLPIFPRSFIPILTNLVIVGEILFSVGLIFPNKKIKRISLYSWTAFHLYSVAIVGFFYPVRCLAFLWTIFGVPEITDRDENSKNKYIYYKTACIVALFAFINFLPNLISKNPNVTLEGLDYGFHMINSNYQCKTVVRELDIKKNKVNEWSIASTHPMNRCYIYDIFLKIKDNCKVIPKGNVLTWSYWQSRNGSPFYELVNESDACKLTYKSFSHNQWIKYPSEAIKVGYPTRNALGVNRRSSEIVINASPFNNEVPSFLEKNYEVIKVVYTIMWWGGFLYFMLIASGISINRNWKFSHFFDSKKEL